MYKREKWFPNHILIELIQWSQRHKFSRLFTLITIDQFLLVFNITTFGFGLIWSSLQKSKSSQPKPRPTNPLLWIEQEHGFEQPYTGKQH